MAYSTNEWNRGKCVGGALSHAQMATWHLWQELYTSVGNHLLLRLDGVAKCCSEYWYVWLSACITRKPRGQTSIFGQPYYRSRLWHTVVCLSVVTFCIVAKRYILAKKCLKERVGNQGQKVDFLGRRHISTSGFASMATETAGFALFLPVQPSDRY